MASVEETRKRIEDTRAELDTTLGRLEERVHHELDWRARLRRNRTRLVIGGAGIAIVAITGMAAARVVQSRRRHGFEGQLRELTHFDDVKREVVRLREQLAGGTKDESVWTKVALKAATAVGGAAGAVVANTLLDKFDAGEGVDPKEAADRASRSV